MWSFAQKCDDERDAYKRSLAYKQDDWHICDGHTWNILLDRFCGRDHIAKLVDVQGYIESIAVDDPKVSRSRISLIENVSYPLPNSFSCAESHMRPADFVWRPWHIIDYLQSTINHEIESTSYTILQFVSKTMFSWNNFFK